MQEKNVCRIFPITDQKKTVAPEQTPEPAPEPTERPAPNPKVFDTPKTKRKIPLLKLCEEFLNEITNEK